VNKFRCKPSIPFRTAMQPSLVELGVP